MELTVGSTIISLANSGRVRPEKGRSPIFKIGLRPLFQALAGLERLGVVDEITGRKHGRVYCYRAYMEILGEDGG